MKKIVVFASGSGSNFQTIVDKLHKKVCEVELLVCDQPDAMCISRANNFGIPVLQVNLKDCESKVHYEQIICDELNNINPNLIVLAGYMKIIGSTLLDSYEGKIINIHPALLPAFPGKDGIGDAVKYGVKVMGVTVHWVDVGVDTGKIIDQESFKREDGETYEESKARIHAIEHEIYPRVIKDLLSNMN